MLSEHLVLGGVEIANHTRLATYLQTVGSPMSDAGVCSCPTITPGLLGDPPYTTPAEDGAPWYHPGIPESAQFAGVMILSADGLEDHPVRREVSGSVTGGGALGPRRVQPRTITVTAVLLGATCCAVDYGLQWLSRALDQDGCGRDGRGCDGTDLQAFNCCPSEAELEADPVEFTARHRRTLRRVALTQSPRITGRSGGGCTGAGECQTGADIITVEFVLTAATPWWYTDPEPVGETGPPVPPEEDCDLRWCVHRPGQPDPCEADCRNAPCPDPGVLCSDPDCRTPAPPAPRPPENTCFCEPPAIDTACFEVDLAARAETGFASVPLITIDAGPSPLRRATITVYERGPEHDGMSCEEVAADERCTPHSVYQIGYVPAGGVLTLDGQIGRATVECAGHTETATDVWGAEGAPVSWRPLACAAYCVCVSVDALWPAAPDAVISISLSGRGY